MFAKKLTNGIYAGFAGGIVMGMMMAMRGMLPMIGQMVGYPSAIAGLVVHMAISVAIGAGFALVLGGGIINKLTGLRRGLVYGGLWWVLGPLTLMPLFMGMGLGVNWNLTAAESMLPSLFAHLAYGVMLGVSYSWLQFRGGLGSLRISTVPTVQIR